MDCPKYQIGKLQRVQNTAAYEHAFPTHAHMREIESLAWEPREMLRNIFLDLLLRSLKFFLFSFYWFLKEFLLFIGFIRDIIS